MSVDVVEKKTTHNKELESKKEELVELQKRVQRKRGRKGEKEEGKVVVENEIERRSNPSQRNESSPFGHS
jgi:hypothetical protein